eukprot:8252398-Pyramimonas_sp.AAC.1
MLFPNWRCGTKPFWAGSVYRVRDLVSPRIQKPAKILLSQFLRPRGRVSPAARMIPPPKLSPGSSPFGVNTPVRKLNPHKSEWPSRTHWRLSYTISAPSGAFCHAQ